MYSYLHRTNNFSLTNVHTRHRRRGISRNCDFGTKAPSRQAPKLVSLPRLQIERKKSHFFLLLLHQKVNRAATTIVQIFRQQCVAMRSYFRERLQKALEIESDPYRKFTSRYDEFSLMRAMGRECRKMGHMT